VHLIGLHKPNRITRIIVGTALAMRYVHSCGVVHRDLKPDNILLDFGHSTLQGVLEPPTLIDPDKALISSSVDCHYLAPECYDNETGPKCDVFSFGLILYELIVGKKALMKMWSQPVVMKLLLVDQFRPTIPEWVLPEVTELIDNCLSDNPDDRLSFHGIFKRLKAMNFKVVPDVNSAKLVKFAMEMEKRAASLTKGE
jgi:serine/threonine protein kinase